MRFATLLSLLASVPFLALATPRVGAGADLNSVLTRVDRAGAAFRGLSSDIRRVHHMAVINDDEIDSGTILLKRVKPREMRMLLNLKQPDQKSVAVSGRKADMYYPKIQTVQQYDLGKHRELIDQFFLVGFGTSREDLEKAYNIRLLGQEAVDGQQTAHLSLVPKSEEVARHLKEFQLWISDATGYPVQQKFILPGEETWLITYTSTRINPDLPDSAFKLQLPKNVKWEYLK